MLWLEVFQIQNLEGGSGSIGWTALSQARPDGYTLGFINLPTLCSNIVEELGDYKIEDFEPMGKYGFEPNKTKEEICLLVHMVSRT